MVRLSLSKSFNINYRIWLRQAQPDNTSKLKELTTEGYLKIINY
jgi:hypothetical protein